ncbi:hypothetical protein BDFB_012518, partial [Asbolus verrucosus]
LRESGISFRQISGRVARDVVTVIRWCRGQRDIHMTVVTVRDPKEESQSGKIDFFVWLPSGVDPLVRCGRKTHFHVACVLED